MSNTTAIVLGLGVVGVGVALALSSQSTPRASSRAPVLNLGSFIDGAASLLGKIKWGGGGSGQTVIAGSVQNGVGVSSQGGGLVDVDRDSLSDLWAGEEV